MKTFFNDRPNGYLETIHKGLGGVRSFPDGLVYASGNREEALSRLRGEIEKADAIVIGAGSGLSTAAGLTYSGERFECYFFDFAQKYGIQDIYSGGFYPFPDEETTWAWWARHIYFNRYVEPQKPVYRNLLSIVESKDYFVITTNVDHQFQRAGFDKQRLFYTQGDYGLLQCATPCCQKTWDNEAIIHPMVDEQRDMKIPSALIPRCPNCGGKMMPNLRSDERFVEDAGWHAAAGRYEAFEQKHDADHILYLELGVGGNTPGIIKYNFWQRVYQNENALYACLNLEESPVPQEIRDRSIIIGGDLGKILLALQA
jgi:NAD-dependent SIR2 family protein deacetylase